MGKDAIREEWLQIRVNKEEKEAIEKLAKMESLPVGTLIRKMLIDICKVKRLIK